MLPPICIEYKLPFDKEEWRIIKLMNRSGGLDKKGEIRLMTGSNAEEVLCTSIKACSPVLYWSLFVLDVSVC